MNNERYDNIEYNDNWQSIPVIRANAVENEPYSEEYFDETDFDNSETETLPPKKIPDNPQPVIKLQFILSIIFIAIAFLLKNFGGEFYPKAKSLYFDNLNQSIVITLPNTLSFSSDDN